jgi:hypothetical protein
MSKLFKHRPSPAMIVALVALLAALGGTAYAAKKLTYKSLDKEARNKVLPVAGGESITADCEPTNSTTFVDCADVKFNWSKAFPRKTTLIVDGTYTTGAAGGKGECRFEQDNTAVAGTTIKIGTADAGHPHASDHGAGFGLNAIVPKVGGAHTWTVACNETGGDITIRQLQLSGFGVRG